MTDPMTPTEQDKELRDILSKVLLDGQNQIHDLKDGKATPEQITERMFASLDYWQPKLQQLITADRKRVALEARIDELENRLRVQFIPSHWARLCAEVNSWAKYVDRRIAELKAQQEEV